VVVVVVVVGDVWCMVSPDCERRRIESLCVRFWMISLVVETICFWVCWNVSSGWFLMVDFDVWIEIEEFFVVDYLVRIPSHHSRIDRHPRHHTHHHQSLAYRTPDYPNPHHPRDAPPNIRHPRSCHHTHP